ncbi:DUF3500 domain-containing protein [Donghicola mangrovi]|uniref:DUF3500 domain-containing protein n=1 Tax=Donghicola mangrovi TaxID=2729614 RepID=A0A850Q702_9RHOB|nr:DUF3500 domain-containing protein [Donghicola mangrovi]NVO25567.1 DUF3500 domain-containing protein [Donghicola mangrovi]
MSSKDFHAFLKPQDHPRILMGRGHSVESYGAQMLATEKAVGLKAEWARLQSEQFKGITADGTVQEGLFSLVDEGFDPLPAVQAAESLLSLLTPEQRAAIAYPVDSNAWRGWYNPEIPFNDEGVRLEHFSDEAREAFLTLLASCTSARGYEKVLQLLDANRYLGEIYDLLNIMNEWSYHFLMFGTPSGTEPWGWNIYGHHACFNVFILGRQMVISPTFGGVEPNVIDRGDGAAYALFTDEEALGLRLMQSLSADQQARATIYADMEDPSMPPDRFNFADQRHYGGAFQDNRVVPLEGVNVSEFSTEQQALLLRTIESFLEHLPDGPRAARMALIEAHLEQTWWNWIGGHGDDDPFYYRIQSPVLLIEFDHHSGMWLTNAHPEKFHIHTITRIPNGNDYGRALMALHQQAESQSAA